ncbi:MAG: tRNA pseudouridine(54/55) synthase Pus10 [Archaeoglobaceae archaeon]|nr:tRNA pseudouridine(54/55) synthase Pus10 [Archaeoglobaceae archaeon]MDW8118670.1 tRNA pseudouridine(54/55) synthase Pus10 [Archaeoglobaceae archaeon]
MLCKRCAEKVVLEIDKSAGICPLCAGIFEKIDEVAIMIAKKLNFDFDSFQIGIRGEGSFRALQEFFEIRGVDYDLKTEIKNELQSRLKEITGKRISSDPDALIVFNPEDLSFEITIKPFYIYGRYIKRIRNISQTRWLCGKCKGIGCEICNQTGKRYLHSVEELISNPAIELFQAKNAILHGSGREDVDARMLGSGRPFVLEIVEPKKRKIDLSELERKINEFCVGKVAVKNLGYANAKDVEKVKEGGFRKVYRAKVVFDREVSREELEKVLNELIGEIRQKTPERVMHRRADKLRVRRLYKAEIVAHFGKIAVLKFEAEAGLYIKELVSGDSGRTEPNLSKNFKAFVEKLDVLEVLDSEK